MAVVTKGKFQTTPPSLTIDGEYEFLQVDSQGNLKISNATGSATLLASSARGATAGSTGTAISIPFSARRAVILLSVTAAATESSDTLDAYVDVSPDSGTTYLNAVHFTQVLGNGGAKKFFAVLDMSNPGTSVVDVTSDASAGDVRPSLWGGLMRPRWVIVDGGGGPASFTFGITVYFC